MNRRARLFIVVIGVLTTGLWYLHDPPWVGGVTSGILNWEEEPDGVRLRWTKGHATFYVPSSAATITLPLRAWVPGPNGGPVVVSIQIDDRWLADISLPDERAWVHTTLPIKTRSANRSFRRVDLRVNRTVPPDALGVELGVVEAR